ncbi:hypothetical protein [Mitsuaria sp. 7]|uniref:hypothetical protein n=1 Tax=Mitsuaria sp. 7 TaxID=1658665 RepID=UPI0007DDB0CB|nr:hypothetical protein [Mitsuaria sp. 7]ANH70046.1 hypothetical protein ABE85_25115 [Mitsuaria sp. 7]
MQFRCRFPRLWLAGLSWLIGGAAGASTLPPWLLGDETCSATLVTPRVAISSYYCLGHVRPLRRTDAFTMRQWSTGEALSGQVMVDLNDAPVTYGAMPGRQLALFVLDQPLSALNDGMTPLPSYREETWLIQDRAVSPTDLSIRVPQRPRHRPSEARPAAELNRFGTYVQVRDSTSEIYATLGDRPLTYRSVRSLRAAEPQRFDVGDFPLPPDDGPGVDHLGRSLKRAMNGEIVPDRLIDDTLLLTVGTATDEITRVWSAAGTLARSRRGGLHVEFPYTPGTSGGGLLASRGELHDRLVGLVTNDQVHLRLSAFWPAIYRELMARGLKEEALVLAGRLIEQPSGADRAREARIGDVRFYDNPYSDRVEFFRRISSGAEGTASVFPTDARDSDQWAYLGTELPSRRAVVHPNLRAGANRFAAWTPTPPLSPLPGSAPALPAPAAARR